MSGDTARGGFLFQDNYLLKRLLEGAAGRLDDLWRRADRAAANWDDGDLTRFGIEAKSRPGVADSEGRAWDVVVASAGKLELIEVKSGVLTREDMRVFWSRLRREGTARAGQSLVPVLVVDPDKADAMLDKLRGLVRAASEAPPPAAPLAEPGNITNAAVLAAHAFWSLCGAADDGAGAAWTVDQAKEVLARLEIHEHPKADLEATVERLLGLFFDQGLAELGSTPLLGWLAERAVAREVGRRMFTIHDLLAEMGVLGLVASFAPATLRSWREAWNEVGTAVADRTALESRLGKQGETVTLAENQPEAHAVLVDDGETRLLLLGPGGAGKSVILRQLAEHARTGAAGEWLWCGAADVNDEAEVELIARACRFRASVLAWRAPGVRLPVLVDALDEAEPGIRDRWAKALARLGGLANLRLVASVREETWRRDSTLTSQLGAWRTVEVKPWPEAVIERLLTTNPRYAALTPGARELLRTPILLDVFWRAFVEETGEDDAAGADGHGGPNAGPETRHGLIAAFWQRRLVGAKRYQEVRDWSARCLALWARAAGALGRFTAEGDLAEVAEIAVSEGILVRTGRLRPGLAFRHPLLRDFALAQWCLDAVGTKAVAGRWRGIAGGITRRGVLRALVEALADKRAGADWPALDLATLAQEIARGGSAGAEELVQFLGAREARPELDPARWPVAVQAALPASYGASLLTSARLAGETSWAAFLAGWDLDARWMDGSFPQASADYAESLAERAKRDGVTEKTLHEAAKVAARHLRRLAEARRFEAEFLWRDERLRGESLKICMEQLPDEATFRWVERVVEREAPWWVRTRVVEGLGHMAKTDARRAVGLYRRAVGLHESADGWHIHPSYWGGTLSRHVFLEWPLGGRAGVPGCFANFRRRSPRWLSSWSRPCGVWMPMQPTGRESHLARMHHRLAHEMAMICSVMSQSGCIGTVISGESCGR